MMAVDGNERDGGGWRPGMVISEMVVDGVFEIWRWVLGKQWVVWEYMRNDGAWCGN